MHMLCHDYDEFLQRWPDAAAFIQAAELRFEYEGILSTNADHGPTPWFAKRLEELKQCPACQEPWFLHMLSVRYGREG